MHKPDRVAHLITSGTALGVVAAAFYAGLWVKDRGPGVSPRWAVGKGNVERMRFNDPRELRQWLEDQRRRPDAA